MLNHNRTKAMWTRLMVEAQQHRRRQLRKASGKWPGLCRAFVTRRHTHADARGMLSRQREKEARLAISLTSRAGVRRGGEA